MLSAARLSARDFTPLADKIDAVADLFYAVSSPDRQGILDLHDPLR